MHWYYDHDKNESTCSKGECFDLTKHPQGTEIKAITYSNMQVNGLEDPKAEKIDIFVIVDIW